MDRFARWTLFAACLTAGIGAAPAARAQTPTGDLELHVGVPSGYDLSETSVLIRNNAIGYFGIVNFGGGFGPFAVVHLPAGSGYTAAVTSTPLGGGACSGMNPGFPIFEGSNSTLFVNLLCERLPAGGGTNGDVNLHLGVPAGWTLDQISVKIQNPTIGYSGSVNFSGGGTGPFSVTNLPAANGYTATISATNAISGVGTAGVCSGSNPSFAIFADATTINYVRIDCTRPPGVAALGRYVAGLAVALALTGWLTTRRRRLAQ